MTEHHCLSVTQSNEIALTSGDEIALTSGDEIALTSGDEFIRITSTGFYYKGQFIDDAGECHHLLVNFLRRAVPQTEWKHAND